MEHTCLAHISAEGREQSVLEHLQGTAALAESLLSRLEKNDIYPAHIRCTESGSDVQTVQEHCMEAAEYARAALDKAGLGITAQLAASLHDLGKLSSAFRRYIVDAAEGRDVRRGSVNHSFAGVRFVLEHLCSEVSDPLVRIAAEHIAYAIGAHHGLFDAVDQNGEHGFNLRRTKKDPNIDEGVKHAGSLCNLTELRSRLVAAGQEMQQIYYARLPDMKNRHFYAHLLSRLLLSAVIEGDRRSTAEFLRAKLPERVQATPQLWDSCLNSLENELTRLPKDNPLQHGRAVFSAQCREFAEKPGGIYRLNLPTGAGKTLSSLRYALAHAKRHGKEHIFFVMPLLAIIDQNSLQIRDKLCRDDIILEHHSNVLHSDIKDELDRRELLMETWDAPIVITTLVQFLNTLFSHNTASIRRFHSLCNSVIILDEAQTVPSHMLSLFNRAIEFLSAVCGATVVLCSATQPALNCAQRPLSAVPEEIIPHEDSLWSVFKRTFIQPTEAMDLDEIAAFASGLLSENNSLLIICNKKAQAAQLYRLLEKGDSACFHLSASMCMAHRRKVLDEMEAAKKQGKVLCISTQIMESGIDTSFACVIRLQAGMDSIVQAAGRCNRNCESPEPVPVYVIRCIGEDLSALKDIQAGANASAELFEMKPEDLESREAIESYYKFLYRDQNAGHQDFCCKALQASLYDLLSNNSKYLRKSDYFLNQAYKTAGTHFCVFDNDTVDVVVPYGEGTEEIRRLYDNTSLLDRDYTRLNPFTVSLYAYQYRQLEQAGALTSTPNGILILNGNWYDSKLGILYKHEMMFSEV